MASSIIDNKIIGKLEKKLTGEIIKKDASGYEILRTIWNGYFDRYPAAIARCKNKEDVARCVKFVKENEITFSVRSGGHDYAGNSLCDNGLIIDLSLLNSIEIDQAEKIAVVGPGVRWGEFDKAAQSHGLATTGGTVSTVGIAGYTLGGGTGYLARKHGLALDNLLSAEVVTAYGELVTANELNYADLFWALRGGGGNFGIVTSLEFQLHDVGPEIMAGQVIYPFEQAGESLRFYREFMSNASDELTCYAFLLKIPAIDVFPEKYHGNTALSMVIAHIGEINTAKKELDSLINFGNPFLKAVQPIPYSSAQQMFDEGMTKGNRWYSKAHYLNEISDEAIDITLEFTRNLPGQFSVAYFEPMGGAINSINTELTAFPHREAAFSLHIFAGWKDAAVDDDLISWAKEFHIAMSPHSDGGVYVNLLGHDETERVADAYGSNLERLRQIKKEWDPENLFRHNHNIKPNT